MTCGLGMRCTAYAIAARKTYLFAFLDDHSRLLPGYRWGYAEDTVRLAAALRPALASRGVPKAIYVDRGSAFVDEWLLRACAKLGVRLVHSTPSPTGRPGQDREILPDRARSVPGRDHRRTRRRRTTPCHRPGELNRLLRGLGRNRLPPQDPFRDRANPAGRAGRAGGPVALPAPETLTEAFLWEAHRRVTKTATVSLHGNTYEVDPALVGRKVELVFDPFDLTRIEVRLAGVPMGLAIPHHISRHSHPKAKPETPQHATATVRYRLRATDRDRARGRTGARRQLRRPRPAACDRSPDSLTCSPTRRSHPDDGIDLVLRFFQDAVRPRSGPGHAAPPHRPQRSGRPDRLVHRRTAHRRDHRRSRRWQDRRRACRAGRPGPQPPQPSSTCPTPPSAYAASTTASSPPSAANP